MLKIIPINLVVLKIIFYFAVQKHETMAITSKSRKKYDAVRALAVRQLSQKYEVTDTYVRQIIRGDGAGELADEIMKEYRKLYQELQTTLKK